MISRRGFFRWLGGLALAGLSTATYALAIEPGFRLRQVTYSFTPPRWTPGLKLKVVALADPHLAEPIMPLSRWLKIMDAANAIEPDLIVLLGDYLGTHRFVSKELPIDSVPSSAPRLKAPLGVYAITGNHDWWGDPVAQAAGHGPLEVQRLFEAQGIPVLENKAVRLEKDGLPFWLSGTSSMVAIKRPGHSNFESRADIPGTIAQVTDDAPIIHMAHEPDLIVDLPERISVTLSGHTHGGQIRLFGWSPVVPSMYGNRFAYGHVIEEGKHLIVSGGLGCSIMPVRFGMPPEITVLELG